MRGYHVRICVSLGLLVVTGMGLGLLLDLQRAWIQVLRLRGILLVFADILYWVWVTGVIFCAFFLANRGEVRFVLLVALLLGFCGYQGMLHHTFSSWCVCWVRWVSFIVKIIANCIKFTIILLLVVLQWLLYTLARPFVLLWKFLCWMWKPLRRFFPSFPSSPRNSELSDEIEDSKEEDL